MNWNLLHRYYPLCLQYGIIMILTGCCWLYDVIKKVHFLGKFDHNLCVMRKWQMHHFMKVMNQPPKASPALCWSAGEIQIVARSAAPLGKQGQGGSFFCQHGDNSFICSPQPHTGKHWRWREGMSNLHTPLLLYSLLLSLTLPRFSRFWLMTSLWEVPNNNK